MSGLTGRLAEVLAGYRAALVEADVSDTVRHAYGSRVAGFLDWLDTDVGRADGDPFSRYSSRGTSEAAGRERLTGIHANIGASASMSAWPNTQSVRSHGWPKVPVVMSSLRNMK